MKYPMSPNTVSDGYKKLIESYIELNPLVLGLSLDLLPGVDDLYTANLGIFSLHCHCVMFSCLFCKTRHNFFDGFISKAYNSPNKAYCCGSKI